jgi:HAMP domain-containing protein
MRKLWLNYWNNNPLAVKFTLVIVFLITLAVTSVTGLSIYRERVNFQSQVEEQAQVALDSAAAMIGDALLGMDMEVLEHYADELLHLPNITHVAFYAPDGKVVAEFGDTNGNTPISAGYYNEENPVYFWQNDRLHAIQGLWTPGELLGGVSIQMEMSSVLAKEAALRDQGLLVASIIIFVGIIMAALLSRSVTEPLAELVRASRRVSKGNLTHDVPTHSEDEIGELARAFN